MRRRTNKLVELDFSAPIETSLRGAMRAPKVRLLSLACFAALVTVPSAAAPSPEAKLAAAAAPADSPSPAPEPDTVHAKPAKKPAAVSSLQPEEIEGFEDYPSEVQKLIRSSLALTTKNLRYQYGSSDPKSGGMDCSGTVYYVLNDCGVKDVPRPSDEMCQWVMRHAMLYRTEDARSLKEPMFSSLKPGDLLFWTGTYETSTPRQLPISHVMIYLGKRKKDGKPVVFGASDGRTYDSERRNGVSVFDFSLPKREKKSEFYGYGPVPGLGPDKRAKTASIPSGPTGS